MTARRILKVTDSKARKPLAIAREKSRAAAPRRREHILIVDDENLIVQTGKEVLENLGYRVTGRTSSREALETVRLQPEMFDLVITDFIMPQMNGVELARELTRLRPDMPIILFSAIRQAVSAEKARRLGIKDYLIKPMRAAELHQAIRRVLDSRPPGGKVSKEKQGGG